MVGQLSHLAAGARGSDHPLLRWPAQAESAEVTALLDAQSVLGLERAEAAVWQAWQQRRFAELLAWMTRHLWWQQWLGADYRGQPLHALPIMQRKHFRQAVQTQGLASPPPTPEHHGRALKAVTAGSRGMAQPLWRTGHATRMAFASLWADHWRRGRDLAARFAMVTTRNPEWGQHGGTLTVQGAQATALSSHRWPLLGMSESIHLEHTAGDHANLPLLAERLAREAPQYLSIEPGTLSELIGQFESGGLGCAPPRMAQVLTSGAAVDARLRERTREVLGALIADHYQCEEIGALAHQCPTHEGYMHVAITNAIVEVVRVDGTPCAPGEPGRVLATGLHQFASPALRLDLGDHAAMHMHCPGCGAQLPTLSQVLGHRHHLLRMPTDGGVAAERKFFRLIRSEMLALAPLREHRLLQVGAASLRLEVVAERALSAAEHASLVLHVQGAIRQALTVDVVELTQIAWPTVGRRSEIECLLPEEVA